MNKKRMSLAGIAVLAVSAVGAQPLLAQDDDGAEPTEPGVVETGSRCRAHRSSPRLSGRHHDGRHELRPDDLTKFVPGGAFVPKTGEDDRADFNGAGLCVQGETGSSLTEVVAPVELPDGARITSLAFYGTDNAVGNISVTLRRSEFNVPVLGGVVTRSDSAIAAFDTSLLTGTGVVTHDVNPDEVTGSQGNGVILLTSFTHRFYSLDVALVAAELSNHVLCGIEVRYQVPVSAADPGTVFHPISPVRAFDSRNPVYPGAGLLAPNTSKVISIKDGHDAAGVVNALDVVPAGATAITYNITIGAPTGPNFVAVTPGDAASFLASAVNFNGTADIANAATVAIDASRQIKVWGGDQSGSAHVIIDVTGYYAPPVPFPNMAN